MLLKIFTAVLLVFLQYLYADSYKFDYLTTDDGLSQSSVQAIVQDSLGFMWFGTEDGLNMYDGYSFRIFSNDPEDSSTISNNIILSMAIDPLNRLWIGTRVGLNFFNPKYDTFKRFLNDPLKPNSIADNFIRVVYPDPYDKQVIWVGTKGGLSRYDARSGLFKNYFNEERIKPLYVWSIFKDKKGVLWFGTNENGLFSCRFSGNELISFKDYSDDKYKFSAKKVTSICGLPDDRLLIGSDGEGLYILNTRKEIFRNLNLINMDTAERGLKHIERIVPVNLKEKEYWLGTDGAGIVVLDEKGNIKDWVKRNSDYKSTLSNNNILSIFQSANGIVFVGTNGGGINKLNQRRSQIKHFYHIAHLKNSLSHNHVLSIFQNDNSDILWIGTDGGGLNNYDLTKREWRVYTAANSALKNNRIRAVKGRGDNYIWIGTWGGGLYRFNKNTKQFTHFGKNERGGRKIISDFIRSLSFDSNGVLWIGSNDGLLAHYPQPGGGHKFRNWKNIEGDQSSLSGNQIRVVYVDNLDRVWIGTFNNGLNLYDRENGKFLRFGKQEKSDKGLSSNHVIALYVGESTPDIVWVGTFGAGLNRFDLTVGKVTYYSEKNGLPNNVIYGILDDDEGSLWLSTNKGIVEFNPVSEKIQKFNNLDGLQNDEFNGGSYFKNYKGELFFGGVNGLNSFNPAALTANENRPRIVFTDFRIHNIPVNILKKDRRKNAPDDYKIDKCINFVDKIDLSYNQSVVTFEFSALDYFIPEKNRYAYMMEGIDKDWVYSGKRRFVTYSNLMPGSYLFKVKGCNNDGYWNESGARLSLVIHPPWWSSYQAKIIYLVLFLLSIILIVRWKISTMKRKSDLVLASKTMEFKIAQAEMEKKVENEKMRIRISADLHDEIGSNLSSIGLISQMLLEEIRSNKRVFSQLQKILSIAKDSSESLREIVWFINPNNDGFRNVVMKINNTAKTILEGKKVKISELPEFKEMHSDINFNRNYYLIVKEILQNIIKHADAGEVKLIWEIEEENFVLTIIDNGVGFELNGNNAAGNGLRNINRRAQLIDAELKMVSEINKGTTVKISVKIP